MTNTLNTHNSTSDLQQSLLTVDENASILENDCAPMGDTEKQGHTFRDVCNELKEITLLGLPVALATLCRVFIINTDVAFVGHLGTNYLTASSFATTWNQFLSNIICAPAYALNSLCSQAIGAGNPKLAGVWLQLAVVCSTALCLPVLLGYFVTKPVVDALVDIPGVADMAQDYNNVSMLILWPMIMYMCVRQCFQAMQIVTPAMIVSGLTVGFNYWMNMVFVPENGPVGWGLKGSPFATFVSMLFQLSVFLGWCVGYKGYHKPYWGGWSWSCMEKTRVQRFMQMVVPMAFGLVLENSGLQLISLSTGHIGEANIGANTVLSSLFGILWAFYWGIGLSLQVRVGSYLGEGNVQGAKLVAKLSIVLIFVICSVVAVGAYAGRTFIAKLYSTDPVVIEIVEDSMYALILDFYFACAGLCAVNLLEAMAQNKVLAITLSVGMWLVQVPCSLLFAYSLPMFKDTPVEGIWLGQVAGEIFKLVILWGYLYRLDWDRVAREAQERSEAVEETDAEDALLEHQLEDADINFSEENSSLPTSTPIPIGTEAALAETVFTSSGTSPGMYIGSKSPRLGRRMGSSASNRR